MTKLDEPINLLTDPENTVSTTSSAAEAISALTRSQLEHALDAHRRKLKIYESLKSLNDVIGTQYGDRVLFELIQNAHDAHAPTEKGEIAIRLIIEEPDRGELLVANRGRPFSDSNLDAIRNIGTSDKEIGEGIGNKGLGFRSVEALTDNVHIFSSRQPGPNTEFDGYCFRFAAVEEIAAQLIGLGASPDIATKVASNVPRYLVPVTVQEQSAAVKKLAKDGFATVVALPLVNAEAIELAREQVMTIISSPAPVLLFLDRLSSLDATVEQFGKEPLTKTLRRDIAPFDAKLAADFRMERVTLDKTDSFLIVRRILPKNAVLEAVRASIPAAPALKRWLSWKGDAIVSVAVPIGAQTITSPRLFNFLPLDEKQTSPMAGHVDAPFFADIDRRSIKPDLPLNSFLIGNAAIMAAYAALAIVDSALALPEHTVVDLAAWTGPHMQRIIGAFTALKRPLSDAEIWPVIADNKTKWASFKDLYAWPDVRTQQLIPSKLATIANASIVTAAIGEGRLARIRVLAHAVSLPLDVTENIFAKWVEAIAMDLAAKSRPTPQQWRRFFDDIVTVASASKLSLSCLEGCHIFPGNADKLLRATANGLDSAPPVFHRIGGNRGKRSNGQPNPPSSLSRKFRFLNESVEISEASLHALEKAGLIRRYDPLEALNSLGGALGEKATETQRREALVWAFRVWQNSGGKAVEQGLRDAGLFVPCRGGWFAATDTCLSSSWSTLGRTLEPYLHEAAPKSEDAQHQKKRLLVSFAEWPRARSDDKREDWLRFLGVLTVRDGLQPIAAKIQRSGTPNHYWRSLLHAGQPKAGLDAFWAAHAEPRHFHHPMTEYFLVGEVWRLPGQLEHASLSIPAKEALSELIVAYLRENGDAHFSFVIQHSRGFQKLELPTPLQIFLREGCWPANFRGDDTLFEIPQKSWSTTVSRQIPPRFIPRFSAEPGNRAALPSILFDERIGLRDWSAVEAAPARLESLAKALSDLSAAERRDLREQLRRAWHDIADRKLTLGKSLELIVERAAGLELLAPDLASPKIVHVTSERQGFAARALVDRGEAVLDVGEADGATIRDLLAAAGGFAPRLADSGDVQLHVDGEMFQARPTDRLLASDDLSWLCDVAVLAHEHLGDALELRTLSAEELDRRIRQIRLRRCGRFALVIGNQEIAAHGDERIIGIPHAQYPTLLMTGTEPVTIDHLIDASQAITKLVGSRRNTLEPMLGRLQRDGYIDVSAVPREDLLARAIRRDVGIVRDHFAATRGGIERRVRAVLPVIAFLKGRDATDRLTQRHDRLGQGLKLREWLTVELGSELASEVFAAIQDTDDQAVLRRRLNFDFQSYGRVLAELGYQPLNSESDFRRLFNVFMSELSSPLVDRVRRRYASDWREERSLTEYVALRTLEFVVFDPTWPIEIEVIDRDFVAGVVSSAADACLGPDDLSILLPNFETTVAANRKLINANHKKFASLIRAWCRKNGVARPPLMNTTDPQLLVRTLDDLGLIDFEVIKSVSLPALLLKVEAWPQQMPRTDVLADLGLTEQDLQHEDQEARKAQRQAESDKRTIHFGDQRLDTGDDDFAFQFEQLADAALAQNTDWLSRSRAPRLTIQQPSGGERRHSGSGGGKRQDWRNQPPDSVRTAMGIASEWLAREFLRQRHPKEMNDECWVSSNRAYFCTGGKGEDWRGYDFRVETARNEYFYEVKSSLDEGGEFELTAREIEVAGSASLGRKRQYRILYVPFVFDPSRWHVLVLGNPMSDLTRNRFRVIRSGSVRYRFERP